jgi:putative transcriptional regulator
MRTLQSYLAITLCLTSTMAVLAVLRSSTTAEPELSLVSPSYPSEATGCAVGADNWVADDRADRGRVDVIERASLAGRVLVASPDMNDPYFAGTVIYMLADDESGSFGVVLNRARDHEEPGVTLNDGGPVGRDRVFMLHDDVLERGSVRIGDVAVAADSELLDEHFNGRGRFASRDGAKARVFVGYAGWGPGQLDSELLHGAWRVRDLSSRVLLSPNHSAITQAAYAGLR